MKDTALHPNPRASEATFEQFRTIGSRLRGPAIAGAAVGLVATIAIAAEIVREGVVTAFHPEHFLLPGVVGFLLPIIVWKGEDLFGSSHLWTLPVDRRRAVLDRVFGGWVWLMVMVALFIGWVWVLALLSGAHLGSGEFVRMLSPRPGTGVVDPTALHSIPWRPDPWLCLVPVTAATGTYLLSSAFAIGTRYPLRWLIGLGLGLFMMSGAGQISGSQWLAQAPAVLIDWLWGAEYGLDMLLTANSEHWRSEALLSDGQTVVMWQDTATDFVRWAASTLLWITLGLTSMAVALLRHRE